MYRIKLMTSKSMGKIQHTNRKPAKKFNAKIIFEEKKLR